MQGVAFHNYSQCKLSELIVNARSSELIVNARSSELSQCKEWHFIIIVNASSVNL